MPKINKNASVILSLICCGIGFLGLGAVAALLPVYSRLLRKINTSVSVEDNGKLDAIDISGEE